MPCSVQIINVNGIVPPGGTIPTEIRVTGYLVSCPPAPTQNAGRVVVKSTVTSPSAPTVAAYPNGGFVVSLPLAANSGVSCGTSITVSAECEADPNCIDVKTVNLACCQINLVSVDGLVLPGHVDPDRIRVRGVALGCYGSQMVSVGTSVTGTQLTPVDPVNGSFAVELPVIAVIHCDSLIKVTVQCAQNPACSISQGIKYLNCPQCARATVSYTSGPCHGAPAVQPITLNATVYIAGGTTRYVRWDYGDGSPLGPVHTVNNSAGTANTPFPLPPETHDYAPGSYTAQLVVTNAAGALLECDKIPLPIAATCNACPTVSVTAGAVGACANGFQSVTLNATVGNVAAGGSAVLQWDYGDGTPTTAFVANANQVVQAVHAFAAPASGTASYTVTLNVISPVDCPAGQVTVTVGPCVSCCPIVSVSAVPSGCAPNAASVAFSAQLSWSRGCTAVAPSAYDWTLNGVGGIQYQITTTLPTTDTSAGWTNLTTGATGPVQFPAGGAYSISATARFAPGTLPSSCNPTGTQAFSLAACCPQLSGQITASEDPSDPTKCTWIYSVQLSNPNAVPVSFQWTFHDGTTATSTVPQVSHKYAVGTSTGATTVTLKSPACPDQTLTTTVTVTCGTTTTTTPTTPPTTPPTTTTPSTGCGVLLVIAIILLLLGGVLVILGICLSVPWLWIAGAIVGAVGLILFIIWAIFCSALTSCSLMRTMHCILFWIIAVVAPIITALALIFGGLPCGIAAAAAWGGWGTLYAWLGFIMRRVGCSPTC